MSQEYNVHTNIANLYKNTENLSNFSLINLQELVANRSAKQLWGNDFILSSEKPEIMEVFNKIEQYNDLFSFFYENEKLLSVFGITIITIDKTKTGDFILNTAQPYAQSRVAMVDKNELQASVLMRYVYADNTYYLRTEYTKTKIIRIWLDANMVMTTLGITEKLDKKFQLVKEETHNLGFVPVLFFQNLPKKNFYGDSNLGKYYPDNTPVKNLQSLLNATFNMLVHELRANRTRIFGKITPQEIQNALRGLPGSSAIVMKSLIQELIDSGIWIQTDQGIMGESSKTIETLVADPKFDKYMAMLNWITDEYIKGCGYSGNENGSAPKTAFELSIAQSDDLETSRVKRTLRQKQYKRMFCKLLACNGIESDGKDFTFEIKENNIIDRTNEIANAVELISNGLSTRVREIKRLNGITEEEAIKIEQEVQAEQDAQMEKQQMVFDQQQEVKEQDKIQETKIKDENISS